MKVAPFFLAAVFMITLSGVVLSQTTKPAVRFTSVYTSLGTGCKVLKGHEGTDDGSLCKGPGGYQVRVYGSAAALNINAEIKGTDDSFPLAMLSIGFDESKTRLEWRLANGKPFAVIMRVPKYGDPTDSDPYFGKVIGQELIVKGLKGFADLDGKVDAKTPNANVEARRLADAAFGAGKKN